MNEETKSAGITNQELTAILKAFDDIDPKTLTDGQLRSYKATAFISGQWAQIEADKRGI